MTNSQQSEEVFGTELRTELEAAYRRIEKLELELQTALRRAARFEENALAQERRVEQLAEQLDRYTCSRTGANLGLVTG